MRILYTPVKSVDWAALDRIPGLCWQSGQVPSGYNNFSEGNFLSFGYCNSKRLSCCSGVAWAQEHGVIISWPEFLKEVRKEMGDLWEQEDL